MKNDAHFPGALTVRDELGSVCQVSMQAFLNEGIMDGAHCALVHLRGND
jgi:hypothetical protein